MEFLAGMLCGGALVAIVAIMIFEHYLATLGRAVQALNEAADERVNRETYDDADSWKYGRAEEDDE